MRDATPMFVVGVSRRGDMWRRRGGQTCASRDVDLASHDATLALSGRSTYGPLGHSHPSTDNQREHIVTTADADDPVECHGKIQFLQAHVVPRKILGHEATVTDFADRLNVNRSALRDQIKRRRLPSATQTALALKLDFDLNWPEWATGTAQAFIDKYKATHERRPPPPPPDVLLRKGPSRPPERCKIKGLAAAEWFLGQIGRGKLDAGFEISCGKATMNGIPVSIRVGEVSWQLDGAQLDPTSRKGRGTAYKPTGSAVSFEWNGADTFNPAWRVEADGSSIGNVDITADFGHVVCVTTETKLTIVFGVWRPNIEEATGADTNAVVGALNAISLPLDDDAEVDPSKLSPLKRMILLRMATDALERDGDFLILARHVVTFEAAE